jgi:deoxyribose-phosphate aldolase
VNPVGQSRLMLETSAVCTWLEALCRWTLESGPVPSLLESEVTRPGGPAPQRPWGPEAAEALLQPRTLAPYLDHTLLRPDATPAEIRQLGQEARAHGFGGACVHPLHLPVLVGALEGAAVEPVSVVGFPHGAHRTEVKVAEAGMALQDGARALDVVVALGRLRAFEPEPVLAELRALVVAAGAPVRAILETGLLPPRAVALGAGLALLAGCDAVKTSTGFSGPGARPEDVRLLRACVGDQLGVKASGGIRTAAQARALVAAGASRLGTSVSVALVTGE